MPIAALKCMVVRVILSLLIAVVICFSIPVFVHRRSFDSAFMEWSRNPTPVTQAALEQQREENRREAVIVQTAASLVLFAAFNAAWFGVTAILRCRAVQSPKE